MSKPTVKIDGKPVAAGTAAAFDKLAAAFKKATGETLHVRSGVRDTAEQRRIFLARYRVQATGSGPFGDVRWYQGKRYVRHSAAGTVAVPGTSRHEIGRAVDVYDSGKDYGVTRKGTKRSNWIKSNASKHGFTANGFGFGEPWHIEYTAGDQWKATSAAKPQPAPKPKPTPKPDGVGLWLGFANVYGGYTLTDKDWGKREPHVAAKLRSMGCSLIAVTELHEENGMAERFARLMPDHALHVGDLQNPDGNGLLYDPKKWLVDVVDQPGLGVLGLYGKRNATVFRCQRVGTTAWFYLTVSHLTAGDPIVRGAQFANITASLRHLSGPKVIAADLNNHKVYPGSPLSQAKAAGFKTLAEKSAIKNGSYNSHHGGKASKHIDHILTNDLVKVRQAEQVLTGSTSPKLSDHNFFKAELFIPEGA